MPSQLSRPEPSRLVPDRVTLVRDRVAFLSRAPTPGQGSGHPAAA